MSKRIKHDVGLYVLDEVKQKKLALPGTNVEYDLKRNWRKVRRHIEHPQVQALLVRDFNRCTWGRWRIITSKSRVSHHYPIDENKGVYDLLQPTNPNINLVVRKILYPV